MKIFGEWNFYLYLFCQNILRRPCLLIEGSKDRQMTQGQWHTSGYGQSLAVNWQAGVDSQNQDENRGQGAGKVCRETWNSKGRNTVLYNENSIWVYDILQEFTWNL